MIPIRDWPLSLRLSAARDDLAMSLFDASRMVYGDRGYWLGLSHDQREKYRDAALKALEEVKP